MKDILKVLVWVLLVGGVIALSIWWFKFQFDLCYPEVSSSWWYCFQHASGG